MRRPGVALTIVGLGLLALSAGPGRAGSDNNRPFTQDFRQEDCTFSSTGRNPYFIIEPGYQTVFEGLEGKTKVVNTITVTDRTLRVDGVETRVVEERETHDGQLAEVSLNYFALCSPTNSMFYFGEDVDIYEGGVIVAHPGAWRAGVGGARAGFALPGTILLGGRYYQEIAPGVALDRAEILSTTEVVATPAGTFENCLETTETTPLEPFSHENKWYTPGIGLVQDDTLLLVRFGFVR
ncbi:MAG TPA: hypothetical protein VFT43_01775 [Candidatus Polarisedimenticolia bacterium]|nr:hypothetical protein [Candidatus Polarisedimenticolia bacterium]